MKQPIEVLREQHPSRQGETEDKWRERLTADGVAKFYDRAAVRQVQDYQRAQRECEQSGHLFVIVSEADAPSFASNASGAKPITLTRSEAKNLRRYMAAKDAAEKAGTDLVIVDG